jgi:hypothetical protein
MIVAGGELSARQPVIVLVQSRSSGELCWKTRSCATRIANEAELAMAGGEDSHAPAVERLWLAVRTQTK